MVPRGLRTRVTGGLTGAAVCGRAHVRLSFRKMGAFRHRRRLLLGGLLALPALVLANDARAAFRGSAFEKEVRRLERESRGRLGVALLDTGSDDRFAYRGDERFAMCSTFKLLLVAAVLQRAERGTEAMAR